MTTLRISTAIRTMPPPQEKSIRSFRVKYCKIRFHVHSTPLERAVWIKLVDSNRTLRRCPALVALRACSMLNSDALVNPRVLRGASDSGGCACAGTYRIRGNRGPRRHPFRSRQLPNGEQEPARDDARRGGAFRLRQ